MRSVVLAATLGCAPLFAATAQELPGLRPGTDIEYSPYLQEDFPNQVFFGDTHLHTSFSADAGLVGATTTPDDAFLFAKGEEVISSNGIPARLQRPLDWLVVTDHAENLGIPAALAAEDPVLTDTEWGAQLAEIAAPGTEESMVASYEFWMQATFAGEDPLAGTPFGQTMWKKATEATERHNDPGAFTAFIGFEWTSQPNGSNMHRNIIYRDGKDLADRKVPISSYDSDDPEVLWDWMADYEETTGGRMFAIPHGGNLSNGLMFDDITLSGEPLTADYAERRMQYEPLYEITQMKGDGEAHPMLSPDDAFADYGTWDKGSFGPEPKTPDMLPKEYARSALKRGLAYEAELGANPFKFGVVGSTDAHTGLSTSTEDNFFGKVALVEPTGNPIRYEEAITGRATPDPADDLTHADAIASGIAAVWARENTREALWDAMERKEVYATTGTRLRVRVFGGWDFEEADMTRSDFAAHGYEAGVPMGSDLSDGPEGAVPKLLIRALRDPDGANLDRIQVVKGWISAEGPGERVYDVAWSDDRQPDADGKLPPVGDTVDPQTATYTNAIGEPYLDAFWADPDFDPSQRAFYYVRVLEIPTPRWTTYDSVFFGIDLPETVDASQQERAYTSPIWYTPG
ncbi:DUF3604 domain-containing protein [Tropicimonas marinistellae]|uniref:DUF3604 domain-containing protein n=1 Tax=Tropicimonas marinistellae TaxID=1739787 RepID=UPI0008317694|nr:DUF3604 domain-containing protein [Tropicimonas marinistellae]